MCSELIIIILLTPLKGHISCMEFTIKVPGSKQQTCLCPPGINLIRSHCTYSPAGTILYINAIICHSNKEQSLAPIVHHVPSFATVSHFVVTGQKSWQHIRSICSPSSREINVIILLVPVSWLTWPCCHYHTMCSRFSSKHRRYSSCFTTATSVCLYIIYYAC